MSRLCCTLVHPRTHRQLRASFNNYCLSHVDASFHQVARGLVLPFTVISSIIMLRVSLLQPLPSCNLTYTLPISQSAPSAFATLATFVVTLGFFAGVIFDTHHNSKAASASGLAGGSSRSLAVGWVDVGVLFGIGSSLLSAVHAILIKSSLVGVPSPSAKQPS